MGRIEKKNYSEYFQDSSEGEDSSEEEEKPSRGKDKSESEESDSDESQDDKCYICNKQRGERMCCEGCSHVAHLACTSLKRMPSGDWHCDDCLVKQSQRRTTRNQSHVQNQR